MSKGQRINTTVKLIIAVEALRDPNLPRKAVVSDIKKRIGQTGETLPTAQTLERLISRIRQHILGEDDPWSISASVSNDIPADANGILIKLQRWCLIMGRPLTVREAKWAARLRTAVRSENLLEWAWRYALREMIADSLQDRLVTDDLDRELCFPRETPMEDCIMMAGRRAGILPSPSLEDFVLSEEEPLNNEFLADFPSWVERGMDVPLGQAMEHKLLLWRVEHEEEFSEDADALYALWLQYLSKEPGWKDLNNEKRVALVKALHREVAELSHYQARNWKPSAAIMEEVSDSADTP